MPLSSNLTWRFPLPRTHTGIALANGVMGLLVWGDATLNITVARAGFWDHRGGNDFAGRITFRQMRDLLAAGQEARVREIFRDFAHEPGQPRRPQQIGGGRLELALPDGLRPLSAELDLPTAALRIRVFMLAALLAALSGWLYAHLQRFVNPTPFNLNIGIEYLFMAVVGGSGHLWGALLGATLIALLKEQLQDWLP
ncbi:MAG: hypothetical protein WHX53_06990, partial [Anaerolineae bacterium]